MATSDTNSAATELWPIRLSALWVLAGALAKAFVGTPAELPAPLLASDLDPFLMLVIAVAVESTIAVFALVAPRLGWLPLTALLAAFALILALHIHSGAETCGCFGGALPIPAWVVLVIDVTLLVTVLVVVAKRRPWRLNGAAALGACIGVALGVALGWYADHRLRPLRPVEALVTAAPPGQPTWHMPELIPDQVYLRPITWIGKRLADTELGRWTNTYLFPPDATVIIYYVSCNHCADHLRELAETQKADPARAPNYVLVQIPTPPGYTGRLFVDRVPEGALHVDLLVVIKTWVITPPWDVVIEKGIVKRAQRTKWSGEAGAKPAK